MNQPRDVLTLFVGERQKELLFQSQLTKELRSFNGSKPDLTVKWLAEGIQSFYRVPVTYFKSRIIPTQTILANNDLNECQNLSECHCS